MIKLTPLSQNDPKWKLKKLGSGTGSIGSYGCLLVSYTMILNYFLKENWSPDLINDQMKANKGYSGATKNLWNWYVADKVFGTKYFASSGNEYNDQYVKEWISSGIPVIIKVDGKPIGGLSHYVVAIGDGKIIDPFDGKTKPFSSYKPLGYHVYIYPENSDKEETDANHGNKDTQTDAIMYDQDMETDANNWNYLRKKYDISNPQQIDDKIKSYESKIKDLEEQSVKTKASDDALIGQLRDQIRILSEKSKNLESQLKQKEEGNHLSGQNDTVPKSRLNNCVKSRGIWKSKFLAIKEDREEYNKSVWYMGYKGVSFVKKVFKKIGKFVKKVFKKIGKEKV